MSYIEQYYKLGISRLVKENCAEFGCVNLERLN